MLPPAALLLLLLLLLVMSHQHRLVAGHLQAAAVLRGVLSPLR